MGCAFNHGDNYYDVYFKTIYRLNIKLLNIKNFNKFGGLVQIVNLFGGKENYRNMIFKVKDLLYS